MKLLKEAFNSTYDITKKLFIKIFRYGKRY